MSARHPMALCRCSAFTLAEMLIAIGLLSTFGLLASRTFILAYRTINSSQASHTMMVQFEQATRLLRQDVWGAQTLVVAGEQSVTISQGQQQSAEWRVEEDGALTRRVLMDQKVVEEQRWSELQRRIGFSQDRDGLVLRAEAENRAPEQLRLSSAWRLLQEAGQ